MLLYYTFHPGGSFVKKTHIGELEKVVVSPPSQGNLDLEDINYKSIEIMKFSNIRARAGLDN